MADERSEVIRRPLQGVVDDVKVHRQVFMDEHVAEAGHAANALREVSRDHAVPAKRVQDGRVILRCRQPQCPDQVGADVQDSLDGGLQTVFDRPIASRDR